MQAFMVRSGKDGCTGLARWLREVRNARGLSQAAIGERVGLADTYISRLEHGRITPTLQLLERLAKCLEVELYQFFLVGGAKPESPKLPQLIPDGAQERSLFQAFRKISREDRSLLLFMARQLVSRAGNAGEEGSAGHDEQAQHTQSDHPTAGLNQTIGPDSDGTSPLTPISERRISTAEPEWAKKKARGLEARVRL
jgi:transcriptional regulator with XRE-family HTH domain